MTINSSGGNYCNHNKSGVEACGQGRAGVFSKSGGVDFGIGLGASLYCRAV